MARLTSLPQIHDFDPMKSSATNMHPLGTLVVADDGRKYRFAKNGATALVAGHVLQGPAIIANHQNVAVQAVAAIGATSVSVTLGATASAANQYAEGYLIISDATGEGHTYKVKDHAAVASSGVITVNLFDPIKVALTTSSEVCFIANPWNGVIDYPTTSTQTVAGIAPFAVAIDQYFWAQTGGVTSLLAAGTIGVMTGVAVPGSVAGGGTVMAATLSQIGYALQAGVDTEYRAVFLTID